MLETSFSFYLKWIAAQFTKKNEISKVQRTFPSPVSSWAWVFSWFRALHICMVMRLVTSVDISWFPPSNEFPWSEPTSSLKKYFNKSQENEGLRRCQATPVSKAIPLMELQAISGYRGWTGSWLRGTWTYLWQFRWINRYMSIIMPVIFYFFGLITMLISIKLTRTTPQGASFKVQCAFSCMFWSSEFSSPHFWRKANDLTGRSCFSPAKTWKRKHETGFSGQLASNMRPKEPLNGVVN